MLITEENIKTVEEGFKVIEKLKINVLNLDDHFKYEYPIWRVRIDKEIYYVADIDESAAIDTVVDDLESKNKIQHLYIPDKDFDALVNNDWDSYTSVGNNCMMLHNEYLSVEKVEV